MPVPLLVASHTVRGTCTVGFNRATDGVADTITVPEGIYWNDPIYGSSVSLAYSLQGKVASLMNTEEGASVWTINPSGAGGIVEWQETEASVLSDITPATCNAEGKRILQRLGLSPSTVSTPDGSGYFSGGFPHGLWDTHNGNGQYRQERNVTFPGVQRERGGVLVGFSGRAWPATVGTEEERRVITLEAVPRVAVRDEVEAVNRGTEGDDTDRTLYTLFWKWASRGELVRVYSDRSATKTYVTAAVTATATTISVASGTGLADDEVIWVDGERMYIRSGGGTSTLTVERPEPVTHPAGAPVSDAHVATYALDADGGNVNLLDFAPVRRGYNNPYYDVEIALVRATWEG